MTRREELLAQAWTHPDVLFDRVLLLEEEIRRLEARVTEIEARLAASTSVLLGADHRAHWAPPRSWSESSQFATSAGIPPDDSERTG